MQPDYLERILNAHVYDVAIETPLDPAPSLSARTGNRVLVKRDDLIAGQGTSGMEILRRQPQPIHAIFCCVGGGGLIGGVSAFVKRLRPGTKIIGVEAEDADAMDRSLKAGQRVRLEQVGLFADG